jgi:hypothetical protein
MIIVRISMHGLSNSVEALLHHCLLALTFDSCSVLACFTFPFMCLQFCWIVYLLAKHTVPAADLAAVVKQQQKQKAATPVYWDLIRLTHCLPCTKQPSACALVACRPLAASHVCTGVWHGATLFYSLACGSSEGRRHPGWHSVVLHYVYSVVSRNSNRAELPATDKDG